MFSSISQVLTILTLATIVINAMTIEEYVKLRQKLIQQEAKCGTGAKVKLNEKEKQVNDIIMTYKIEELNQSFQYPETYKFCKHYFHFKDSIETSLLYKIIKAMPKGAMLHAHSNFMLDEEFWLNVTYEDNLYACIKDDNFKFRFSHTVPDIPCASEWSLLSELRLNSGDVNAFDQELKKKFTLITDNEDFILNSDQSQMWKKFDEIWQIGKPLTHFRPVLERHIKEMLKRSYEDNVMYIELRGGLHVLYELDGTEHSPQYVIQIYKNIIDEFIKEHPDFIGLKYIVTQTRSKSLKELVTAFEKFKEVESAFPDMIAGFDLVGHEDAGLTLKEFLPALFAMREETCFYFHAGETSWWGSQTDDNLIDAILLGTRRIGHGFSIVKHPVLMNTLLKKDIAIEVNVISNSVLRYVRDFRNHPLATFLALGLPVVLSSDDPGIWGAPPLSHDFYIAFVAIASRRHDLRVLKELVTNSIKYSSLNNEEKSKFYKYFEKKWEKFLDNIIYEFGESLRRSAKTY